MSLNPVPIYRAAVVVSEGPSVEGTKYRVFERFFGLLRVRAEYLGFTHNFINRWRVTFTFDDGRVCEIEKNLNDGLEWTKEPDEESYAELRLVF